MTWRLQLSWRTAGPHGPHLVARTEDFGTEDEAHRRAALIAREGITGVDPTGVDLDISGPFPTGRHPAGSRI